LVKYICISEHALFCAREPGICLGSWGEIVIVSDQQWLGTCVKSGQLVLAAPATALLLKPSVTYCYCL